MKCVLAFALLLIVAASTVNSLNIRFKIYVGHPTGTSLPPVPYSNMWVRLLNNSLAITGDDPAFGSAPGNAVTGFNNVAGDQYFYWDIATVDYHNYFMQHANSGYTATRIAVGYNQASGNCAAGASVDLAKRLSPAGQDLMTIKSGWWQFRAGGYASTYTTFPVRVDVANCSLSSMSVILVRADGTTTSPVTINSISVPYVATNALTTLLFNVNAGASNQIKAVQVQTSGGTCRMARVKVETQQTNSAPNYTCYYRSHPISLPFGGGITNGYIYTNPDTWIPLSSSSGESFEFKCVINSDFC